MSCVFLIFHGLVVKCAENEHEAKPLSGGEGVEVNDTGQKNGEDLAGNHDGGEKEGSEFLFLYK
jgi:hypothetical protein